MFKDDEDYYIKVDDGNIVKENKTKDIDFINDTIESHSDDMPHYNSPEYAEYISKLNREGLKEISSEDINNVDVAMKIKKEIKEKYPKKQIQLCILALIVVLFLAIIFTTNSMMKNISNTGVTPNHSVGQNSESNESFKFLTNVTAASGSDSIDSYNTLKELAVSKKDIGYAQYKNGIKSVKENAQTNLNDVNSLSSYIRVEDYEEIVSCLKNRYENLISLCDKMLEMINTNPISVYNKFALIETNIVDELNNAIIEKAKVLNVGYKIENEKIVLYLD